MIAVPRKEKQQVKFILFDLNSTSQDSPFHQFILLHKRLKRILEKLLRNLPMKRMHQLTRRQTPFGTLLGAINLHKSMIDPALAQLLVRDKELDSSRQIEDVNTLRGIPEQRLLAFQQVFSSGRLNCNI